MKAAVEQLPLPPQLTGPLPSLPSPSLELRCWQQSLNPWKPQSRLEIWKEEVAESYLAHRGEGE